MLSATFSMKARVTWTFFAGIGRVLLGCSSRDCSLPLPTNDFHPRDLFPEGECRPLICGTLQLWSVADQPAAAALVAWATCSTSEVKRYTGFLAPSTST